MRDTAIIHETAFRADNANEMMKNVNVLVCGVGALGSNLVENLIRQGFANITAIDYDTVEEHNIGTQTYCYYDIGRPKVQAIQRKLFRDLEHEIVIVNEKLTAENQTIMNGFDLVVDTFDNNCARTIVSEFCSMNDIACIHAGMSDDGYSQVIWDDKYRIPNDNEDAVDICDYPLARNLVMVTTSLLAEAIIQYVTEDIENSLEFTLLDMKISHC